MVAAASDAVVIDSNVGVVQLPMFTHPVVAEGSFTSKYMVFAPENGPGVNWTCKTNCTVFPPGNPMAA